MRKKKKIPNSESDISGYGEFDPNSIEPLTIINPLAPPFKILSYAWFAPKAKIVKLSHKNGRNLTHNTIESNKKIFHLE